MGGGGKKAQKSAQKVAQSTLDFARRTYGDVSPTIQAAAARLGPGGLAATRQGVSDEIARAQEQYGRVGAAAMQRRAAEVEPWNQWVQGREGLARQMMIDRRGAAYQQSEADRLRAQQEEQEARGVAWGRSEADRTRAMQEELEARGGAWGRSEAERARAMGERAEREALAERRQRDIGDVFASPQYAALKAQGSAAEQRALQDIMRATPAGGALTEALARAQIESARGLTLGTGQLAETAAERAFQAAEAERGRAFQGYEGERGRTYGGYLDELARASGRYEAERARTYGGYQDELARASGRYEGERGRTYGRYTGEEALAQAESESMRARDQAAWQSALDRAFQSQEAALQRGYGTYAEERASLEDRYQSELDRQLQLATAGLGGTTSAYGAAGSAASGAASAAAQRKGGKSSLIGAIRG